MRYNPSDKSFIRGEHDDADVIEAAMFQNGGLLPGLLDSQESRGCCNPTVLRMSYHENSKVISVELDNVEIMRCHI
jgi:hypothetical protein